MEEKKNLKYFIRVGGVLFIICALTALLLSVVNALTSDKIAENSIKKMNNTISEIFDGDIVATELDFELSSPVSAVYEVTLDGDVQGYAVYVIPTGFKGDIEMMVGINTDGSCRDVKIISLSETPGLGSKVNDDDFLGQYDGGSGSYVVKDNITPIAGATISSKAVTTGVNAAMDSIGGIIG